MPGVDLVRVIGHIGGMADPLSLAALGGVAATEGIKFLYGQVAEVVKEWRGRRDDRPQAWRLPIGETGVLDAAPSVAPVNAAVLLAPNTTRPWWDCGRGLAPYAQGLQDVDVGDEALARTASELRALLEAAYGQRFTFR